MSSTTLPLPDRKTHRGRILGRLQEANGAEVPAPELARIGGLQFQTRIYELRHDYGLQIGNRTERDDSGQVHSFYRLVTNPAPTIVRKPRLHPEPKVESLFGDLQPTQRHRDDG